MNSSFKVGEVVILQNATRYCEMNGMEATVAGPLQTYDTLDGTIFGYFLDVLTPCGLHAIAMPHQLRRKQPPSDMTQWAASKVKDLLKPVKQGEPA